MRKNKKWLFSLIFIILFIIAFQNNYYHLKDYIQTFVDCTFAYVNKNTNDLEAIISNGDLIDEADVSELEDSGITGYDYTPNATYYPYYEFLNSNEQTLYKQIYANGNALATTFVPTITVTSKEVTNAMEAVYHDHPELFWLDTSFSYKYTKNGKVVQIILDFNETSLDINTDKTKFYTNANLIINAANKFTTTYQKEKYVHDAIIEKANYYLNAPMNQSAYSALVNGSTVCAGYARAFQYIMIQLGIPTYYVTGDSNGDHAWNIVALDDGYYNVDLTWDDTNPISYTYFNVNDSQFSKTHTRTGSSLSLPACNGNLYQNVDHSANNSTSGNHSSYSSTTDSSNSSSVAIDDSLKDSNTIQTDESNHTTNDDSLGHSATSNDKEKQSNQILKDFIDGQAND